MTAHELLPLAELPQGTAAIVATVEPHVPEAASITRRLAEIGFLPGEQVRVLRRLTGGEPLAVRIGTSTFALRKHEAQCIHVKRKS